MNQTGDVDRGENGRLAENLLELIGSSWKTQAVYVAAELSIGTLLLKRQQPVGGSMYILQFSLPNHARCASSIIRRAKNSAAS